MGYKIGNKSFITIDLTDNDRRLRQALEPIQKAGLDLAKLDFSRGFSDYLHSFAWLRDLSTVATRAQAAGTGMPWEQPLQQVLDSVQGPVAKIVAVIIIIATGLALAFGDTSGGFRRLIQIVFGLSIAFAASSFFLSFFSFGGGALV